MKQRFRKVVQTRFSEGSLDGLVPPRYLPAPQFRRFIIFIVLLFFSCRASCKISISAVLRLLVFRSPTSRPSSSRYSSPFKTFKQVEDCSGQHWTSPAKIPSRAGSIGLTELPSRVGQRRTSAARRHVKDRSEIYQKICQKICQKIYQCCGCVRNVSDKNVRRHVRRYVRQECQKICQRNSRRYIRKECRTRMSEDVSEEKSKDLIKDMSKEKSHKNVRKNVRRNVR